MSSILKALKKLENETLPHGNDQSWSQKIDTRKAINRRMKGPWLFNRLVFVLFIAIVVVVVSLLILEKGPYFKKQLFQVNNPPPARKERPEPTLISVKKRVPKKKGIQPLQSKPINYQKKESLKQVLPEKDRSLIIPEKKSTSPGFEQQNIPPGRKQAHIRQMDDSKYKLEAIVWSNNPESRFAVINGQIVKPGASFEGMKVTRINRDSVTVFFQEEELNLRFQIEK